MSVFSNFARVVQERRLVEVIKSGKATKALSTHFKNFVQRNLKVPFRYGATRLAKGANFTQRDIVRGGETHSPQGMIPLDERQLERLCSAYRKMMGTLSDDPTDPYYIGGLWESWRDRNQVDFSRALLESDLGIVKALLSQMGSHDISLGISLAGDVPRTRRDRLGVVNRINTYSARWQRLTDNRKVAPLPAGWGSFSGAQTPTGVIIPSLFRFHYGAERIERLLITSTGEGCVVEIGAGFGGTAFQLFSSFDFSGDYYDFDIPETLTIASAFLMASLSHVEVVLYGESPRSSGPRIFMNPHFAIKEFNQQNVDVVFNSHSLTELNAETVFEYLQQIDRISPKFFLHMNHEYGSQYRDKFGGFKSHLILRDKQYQLPSDRYTEVYRFPEMLTNDGGSFGLYDYWEYLYMRNDTPACT